MSSQDPDSQKNLLLAVVLSMLVMLGWQYFYAGPQLLWLSAIVGGTLFGFGMVLASGCGSKSLVRLGAGNLKSLVVLLVLGVSAFATLRGVSAVLRVNSVDRIDLVLASGQDLPSLLAARLGVATPLLAVVLGTLVALLLVAWVLRHAQGRTREVWLGGVGLGAVIAALWGVSGVMGHLAEDPGTLEEVFLATNSKRMESLSMVAPVAYTLDWLMFFSDRTKLLTLGIVSMAGVVAGSAAVALASRDFRWEGFANIEDMVNHIVGGLLMGVGGITALGCTVGQGLSGVSTLSLGSFLAVGAIIAGAVLALRYQVWRLERSA